MDQHPANLGAQQQGGRLASSGTAPNVRAHGSRLRLASFLNDPAHAGQRGGSGGMSAFSNVRTEPYAPGRISSVEPQALTQLLHAYLLHHGTHQEG
jgi:hypothetical protein